MADPTSDPATPDRPPHKRLRLTLDVEAHDLNDLTMRLHDITTRLVVEQREQIHIVGGTYTIDLECNQETTQESYEAELDAWVQRRREAKADG